MNEQQKIEFYGFTPVVRDQEILFKDHPTASGLNPRQDPFKLEDFPFPDSQLVQKVKEFVKGKLNEQTFNHSNRIFIYGVADAFLATTKMSFEFKGAIIAREVILANDGAEDQADGVCEAIVRHQDIFVKGGNITTLGQVLQLSTLLDNVGLRAHLIHPDLIAGTCAAFPRKGWSDCFARTIEKELSIKPWCHSTTFEIPGWVEGVPSNFARDVRGNDFMKKYD
ncbi:cyanamide hydratase [Pyrrhoderma noxium]|uniref:Cyanamide hydratase n=1 Tax=Pyrrhoderma noxium TaxID=2282107 RepID=A0A286U864_9AGAM|nr:cyanamide hydratase [Pyrrhoderma noxium]